MRTTGDGGERVDVLVVTAIKLEYDQLLAVHTGASLDSTWKKEIGPTGFRVLSAASGPGSR